MVAELHFSRRVWAVLVLAVAFAATAVERWQTRHLGLIYPDGYQYLEMAKGIATHLTPTIALGRGGDLFAPSVDAALKPLYPALVALLSASMSLQTAGQMVTALSAGAVVPLVAALTGRLSGSRLAALAAGLGALVSPMLGYWAGFTGPDPLAEALALGCALALVCRRAALAGVLGALCAAARPEWGLAFLALALAGLAIGGAWREQAGRALIAGAFTLAAVVGVLRPPLALPPGGVAALLGLLSVGVAVQLLAHRAAATIRARIVFTLGCAVVAAGVALSGHSPALRALVSANWPLVLLAVGGALAACREPFGGSVTALLAAVAVPFAAYEYRNPSSARYASQLIPLLCLLGALAVPALARVLPRRRRALGAVCALGLVLAPMLSTPSQPATARDYFETMALWLRNAPPGPLISATPDAFGVLLPGRAELNMAPGARGLILLDAAQREYAPAVTASGHLIGSYLPPDGFERPDGSLDGAPERLVAGTVTR